MNNTVDDIWKCVLSELQSQVTRATYQTWIKDSEALRWNGDGHLVVGVRNGFARDWLESRLQNMVERILIGVVGHPVHVTFTVMPREDDPKGSKPSLPQDHSPAPPGMDHSPRRAKENAHRKFLRFNPTDKGFLMMSKYAERFWQPLLGPIAYAVYRFLRTLDRQNHGWGKWHFVNIDEIAATTANGNRQAITGVQRKRADGRIYRQPGALDVLSQAGLAQVEVLGKGSKTQYRVSCLNSLPLLTPAQVKRLPEVLQSRHREFLGRCSIEYEEWQRLSLPSLVQGA